MKNFEFPAHIHSSVEACYRQTLELFAPYDDSLFEIRTVSSIRLSGYFMNKDDCISWLMGDDSQCWYITLNPVLKSVYAREQCEMILSNRYCKGYKITRNKMSTTADAEIERLRWILLDFDTEKPSGISSTDEEKYAALVRMREGYKYITERLSLPEPVVCDSGNGYHLLLAIDRPVEDSKMVESFLKTISNRFSDDVIKVDTSVGNPARITKCYGTMTDKGCNFKNVQGLPDRPHRRSGFIYIPQQIEVMR